MLKALFIGLIRGYKFFLSPWLGQNCRFTPTCSSYAIEAIERFGAVTGSRMAVCRLGRCHPWCQGGYDPVATSDTKIVEKNTDNGESHRRCHLD